MMIGHRAGRNCRRTDAILAVCINNGMGTRNPYGRRRIRRRLRARLWHLIRHGGWRLRVVRPSYLLRLCGEMGRHTWLVVKGSGIGVIDVVH